LENPFEAFDLDPTEGIAAITARLKELAEDAKTEEERNRIRAAWEELTLHPDRRLRAALFAHPETRRPLGLPPGSKRIERSAFELDLPDIAARPSVVANLPPDVREAAAELDRLTDAPPLDDDPFL
jgi:hypothetical protein